MVQLSATRCSYITVLRVSLVRFATVTLCVASQQVFIVVSVYFVTDSVRKLLDTPLYHFDTVTTCNSYIRMVRVSKSETKLKLSDRSGG
jgi:hypothetical protein